MCHGFYVVDFHLGPKRIAVGPRAVVSPPAVVYSCLVATTMADPGLLPGKTREGRPHGACKSLSREESEPQDCTSDDGLWRSLVAHLTGGQGVVGSNPASPTRTVDTVCFTSSAKDRFSESPVRDRRSSSLEHFTLRKFTSVYARWVWASRPGTNHTDSCRRHALD